MPKCIQGFEYKDHNRLNMAKLYWRVKKDGKWTWKPVIWVEDEEDTIEELIEEGFVISPELE